MSWMRTASQIRLASPASEGILSLIGDIKSITSLTGLQQVLTARDGITLVFPSTLEKRPNKVKITETHLGYDLVFSNASGTREEKTGTIKGVPPHLLKDVIEKNLDLILSLKRKV